MRGVSDPWDLRFRPRVVGVVNKRKKIIILGWDLILPVCGATLAFARGATPAARWLHEPQPISNHPVGLGFPHPAERYRPGGSAFASPGCWSCRDMEGFLTRGWEFILPGCGGTSALAQGATLAARWLHEPQPISNHPVGLEFPHPVGRYRSCLLYTSPSPRDGLLSRMPSSA